MRVRLFSILAAAGLLLAGAAIWQAGYRGPGADTARHSRPLPAQTARPEWVESLITPPADAAEEPAAVPSEPPSRPGQTVLTFPSSGALADFLRDARGSGVRVLARLDKIHSVVVTADSPGALSALLSRSAGQPVVSANYLIESPDPAPPLPPYTVEGSYQPFENHALEWLGVTADNASWGSGVKVAIIDTASSAGGEISHGGAVASVIAGQTGVAPASTVLNFDVFQDGEYTDAFTVAQAILAAADAGAHVINMSIGGPGDSPVLREAVAYAQRRGAVVVASAGNEGAAALSFPAGYPEVLAVTAVDAIGQFLPFSNFGEGAALGGPGYGVYTAYGGGLVEFSGTSASAPFVSGALAALLSQERALTPRQAADLLLQYANDAGAPGNDTYYGSGLVNLGRVLQRNTSGIRDIAVAGHYPDSANASASTLPVLVTIQNRGTDPITGARLEVTLDSARPQTFSAPLLPAGSTYTVTVPVDRRLVDSAQGVTVRSTVRAGELQQGRVSLIRRRSP